MLSSRIAPFDYGCPNLHSTLVNMLKAASDENRNISVDYDTGTGTRCVSDLSFTL